MQKYGVIKTAAGEDKSVVLEVCGSKEAVLVAKQLCREKYKGEDCRIDAIVGEFDENNQPVNDKFTLLY